MGGKGRGVTLTAEVTAIRHKEVGEVGVFRRCGRPVFKLDFSNPLSPGNIPGSVVGVGWDVTVCAHVSACVCLSVCVCTRVCRVCACEMM